MIHVLLAVRFGVVYLAAVAQFVVLPRRLVRLEIDRIPEPACRSEVGKGARAVGLAVELCGSDARTLDLDFAGIGVISVGHTAVPLTVDGGVSGATGVTLAANQVSTSGGQILRLHDGALAIGGVLRSGPVAALAAYVHLLDLAVTVKVERPSRIRHRVSLEEAVGIARQGHPRKVAARAVVVERLGDGWSLSDRAAVDHRSRPALRVISHPERNRDLTAALRIPLRLAELPREHVVASGARQGGVTPARIESRDVALLEASLPSIGKDDVKPL